MACARGCCDSAAEHFRSIQLNGAPRTEERKREKRWAKDHDAYRRLRQDGVQPKHLDGAAEMEQRADTKLELQMGQIFDSKQTKTGARIGVELSQEMGLSG